MAKQLCLTILLEEATNDVNQRYFTARLVIDPVAIEAGFVESDYSKVKAVAGLFEEISWKHRES